MLFIFDMGGVVTTNFGRGKMREWLGLSSDDFRRLQYDFDENLYSLLEVGRLTVPQFWQAIQKNAVTKIFLLLISIYSDLPFIPN